MKSLIAISFIFLICMSSHAQIICSFGTRENDSITIDKSSVLEFFNHKESKIRITFLEDNISFIQLTTKNGRIIKSNGEITNTSSLILSYKEEMVSCQKL